MCKDEYMHEGEIYAYKEGKMFANANFFLYNANFYDKIEEENIRYITHYRKKRKLCRKKTHGCII